MSATPLPRDFYDRDPRTVAQELLGKTMHRRTRQGLTSGTVVEVEAYLAQGDPAAHSARGPTPRNRSMFGPPGHLYVYSIHARFCLNAVTESAGVGSAVLIRAVQPVAGVGLMQSRRERSSLRDLTRGPARLCEALSVARDLDGWDLTRGRRIWIADEGRSHRNDFHVVASPRIGVTSAQEARLRYFINGSPFVSGPRRDHAGEPAIRLAGSPSRGA